MHCTHCGKQLLPDTRFCPSCGTAVSPEPAAGSAQQAASSQQHASSQQAAPPQQPVDSRHSAHAYPRPALLRPRDRRVFAGVCAAFARTYGWNLVLVRILVAIAALHAGLGLLAYAIAWVTIPEEPYLVPSGRL